jgi:hypothetical protein
LGEPDARPDSTPFFEKGGILPSIHYQNWKTAEAMIAIILEQKGSWRDEGIRDIFDNLGIQSWWKILSDHEIRGLPIDWGNWRNKVNDPIVKRGESAAAMIARLIFADMENLETKRRAVEERQKKYVQSVRIADQSPSHNAPREAPYYQSIPKKNDPRLKFPVKREQWREMKTRVRNHLVQGADWNDPWVEGSFQQYGLKAWWETIVKARTSEGKLDWDRVKDEIVGEWHRRYPRTPAQTFVWLLDELKEVEKTAFETRILRNKLTDIAQDVDMKDDAPNTEATAPEPPPLFYPAASPPVDPSISADFDPQEFKLIKEKVKELEESVATTMEEVKERLKTAEEYAHEAMITLVELKWQVTQAKGDETKEAIGKGEERRNRRENRTPTHHYFTRYAEARYAANLRMDIKEYRDLEERIRRSEERVEETARTMDEIKDELAKFEALKSQVVTLSRNFENFRLAQVNINLSMIANYARLRTELAGTLEPALVVQGRTILDLQTRFNALTALAANFFGEQQMMSVLAPAKVSTPTPYPYPSNPNSFETTPKPLTV